MTMVLTPTSVTHYNASTGERYTSSYEGGSLPSSLAKYNDSNYLNDNGYSPTYNNATAIYDNGSHSTNTSGSSASGSSSVPSASNGFDMSALNSMVGSLGSILSGAMTQSSSQFGDALREAMQIAAGNSAQSQANAREMMDFQTKSDQYAMNWSANEAAKSRQWQEEMSNTAHVREVKDLVNAGLNPVLSVNGGASTPSGATGSAFTSSGAMGQVDTSATALFGNLINSATQLESTRMNLNAQLAMLDKQILSNEKMNLINNETSLKNYQMSSSATVQAANAAASANRYSADQNYLSSIYGIDQGAKNAETSANATKYAADANASKPTGTFGDAYLTGTKIGQAFADLFKNAQGILYNASSGRGK